jgi:hypothetical protein
VYDCAKLLILCGVSKVVERYEIPHEIKGQLSVKNNNVEVDYFSCS